jgi:MFS family permease
MISAVFIVILQLYFYPILIESYGTLWTYRFSCNLFAVVAIGMPMISYSNQETSPFTIWVLVIGGLVLMGTATMFTLISVFILINNSCYSHERATVNGIGQTFASFGRLCGPVIAAYVFAWSESNGRQWPFNYYFVWYILGIFSLFNSRLALFLPRSIERRKREPKEVYIHLCIYI